MPALFRATVLAEATITFALVFYQAEAQSCTAGFPSLVSDCTTDCSIRVAGNTEVTRVIPDLRFNCTGTVVKWRAAGFFDLGTIHAIMDIWRERSNEPGTYDKVAIIELGTCGSGIEATLVDGLTNVYECTLPESERVAVQPGDIVGIEIARNNIYGFRLYFDTNGGPTNYIFNGRFSTVTLSQSSSTAQDQPQISLTVEMAVQATKVAPTSTAQLPSTSTASLIELTTAANVTTGAIAPPRVDATESTNIDGGVSLGVIAGAVVGGVAGLALLTAVLVLVLTVLHLTRKLTKKAVTEEGENVEMNRNVSYIACGRVSTVKNSAYGAHQEAPFHTSAEESSTNTYIDLACDTQSAIYHEIH